MTPHRTCAIVSILSALGATLWLGMALLRWHAADDLQRRQQMIHTHQHTLQEAQLIQLRAQLAALQNAGAAPDVVPPMPSDMLQAALEKCAGDVGLSEPILEMNCLLKDPGICALHLMLPVPDDLAAFRFLRHLEQSLPQTLVLKSFDLRVKTAELRPPRGMSLVLEGFWLCPVEGGAS